MRNIAIALALTVLVVGPVAASENTDVMVPVHQFIDGFNKGDTKSVVAACAETFPLFQPQSIRRDTKDVSGSLMFCPIQNDRLSAA